MKVAWIELGLMVGLASGCAAEEQAPVGRKPAGFGAAWAEFMAPADIESALPLLASHDVAVNVAWPSESLESEERMTLARRAEEQGVEVRPWLLLPEADGYWPGSTNASLFSASARALMDRWQAEGLAPTTLVVDMELEKGRADELTAHLTAHDVLAAVGLLKSGIDPTRYAEATEEYATLVSEAKGRGWKVHLTTLPQVVDDYADGDDSLRQAFGIPVEGIDWDRVTFQAYRTLFGDLLGKGQPPTSYFVYAYAVDAQKHFGSRAGLDVGMVGHGVTPASTYAQGADLLSDLGAAASAGVPRELLDVYNLDGVVSRAPAEQWLTAPQPGQPPPEDDVTLAIRNDVALLDGVL
ncbi:MAG: hypothetical protein U0263_02470 [Polyangiaceae bacterium]